MMKTIFECETEIGKCNCDSLPGNELRYAEPDYATIYAHTVASLNGPRGMLKIEQHCYLRRGSELPDQPWIKPAISLEPTVGSHDQLVEKARRMHDAFIKTVHDHFPEEYLV